jgi:hypothetical protein
LGFASKNRSALKNVIKKKCLETHTNLEEDSYESPTLVESKDVNALVPLVKANQILSKMGGSWNDSDEEMFQAMVESSKGVDNKPSWMEESSLQYYQK